MNKILAVVVVSVLVAVGGCSKNKPAQSSSNLTNIQAPPPAPTLPPAAPVAYAPVTDPAPVVAPAPEVTTARPVAGGKSYVVKRGDTLWSIAAKNYGDGKQHTKIIAANPAIKGPNDLKAGQTIVLP